MSTTVSPRHRLRHPLCGAAALLAATALVWLSLPSQAADPGPRLDPSKLPAPAKATGLTWEKDVRPMFEKSCVKCHSGDKAKGAYYLDTLAGALKPGEHGKANIVPGESAKSPLLYFTLGLVEDMEMPPADKRDKYPALTKDQVALLRAWIDQGAK